MMNSHTNRRQFICGLTLLFATGFSHSSAASWEKDFLIEGYDVVSYFTKSGPLKGVRNHAVRYRGSLYAFASKANMQAFVENPKRYAPAYNGNCAFGMAYGMRSAVDPLAWKIKNDRLFLMINHSTKIRWNKKSEKYIPKSDYNWQKIFNGTS